jgi:hypothetical protein
MAQNKDLRYQRQWSASQKRTGSEICTDQIAASRCPSPAKSGENRKKGFGVDPVEPLARRLTLGVCAPIRQAHRLEKQLASKLGQFVSTRGGMVGNDGSKAVALQPRKVVVSIW